MVKVRVQHPPEASVKIHQVLKVTNCSSDGFYGQVLPVSEPGSSCWFQVSGLGPTLQTLSSSSGLAGAPSPVGGRVQAQTLRGESMYNQQSGFKYCFREVKEGQVRGSRMLTLVFVLSETDPVLSNIAAAGCQETGFNVLPVGICTQSKYVH